MVKGMGLELIFGQMGKNMKESGRIIKEMVKELVIY